MLDSELHKTTGSLKCLCYVAIYKPIVNYSDVEITIKDINFIGSICFSMIKEQC